eukprot:Phypoly_transcript_06391.p1 GENE.Phypoly_transcript_06391~~Phypoly_transcript_06391.p1  ORF type:complete len:311 (-),score=45.93 Phypoly_transcript_06391:127-1059(-)
MALTRGRSTTSELGQRTQMQTSHSSEEIYTSPTTPICPVAFSKILAPGEDYVVHAKMKKIKKTTEKKYTFLLTKTSYYKLDPETNTKIWNRNINEIFSVREDADDACTFKMVYKRPVSGGNSIKSKVRNTSDTTNVAHNTAERLLITETPESRDEWILAIRRLLGDMWQALLENSYVPPPEVYQSHFYVEKMNRKGKLQMRCLVISTVNVYNISVKGGRGLGKVKWSFPITSLTNLYVYNQPTNVLLLKINTAHLQKMKPLTSVLLHDQTERDLAAAEIRRLFFQKKKYQLPRELGSTWEPAVKTKARLL